MNRVITILRKPLTGTVAHNVLEYGTGGLNIDASRIESSEEDQKAMERCNSPGSGRMYDSKAPIGTFARSSSSGPLDVTKGRWPSNVILTGSAAADLDDDVGVLTSGKMEPHHKRSVPRFNKWVYGTSQGSESAFGGKSFGGDSGGPSRFFKTITDSG